MKTLNYVLGEDKEIEIGGELYFGQIWDGKSGDVLELLKSGAVSFDEDKVIFFYVVKNAENVLNTIVRITDIY